MAVVGAERLDQLKATLRDLVEAAEGDATAGHDVGVAGADDA